MGEFLCRSNRLEDLLLAVWIIGMVGGFAIIWFKG